MHLPRLIVELDLPEQFDIFGILGVDDLFILLPVVAHHIAAVRQPVGCPGAAAKKNQDRQNNN